MNIDTSKLTLEEFKIYNKFNKTIEPKIKKLDFNFTDMKKGELMLISTPKDIVKFIKKIPPAKKYNFKDIPIIGVIEPGSIQASSDSLNKNIGVIGTVATIKSGAYRHALKAIDNNINVFSKDCPLFVPFVEEGMIEGEAINLIVEHYLSSFQNNADTMILGCTHYPLLEPVIKKYVKGIKLVDSASAVAKHADKILNDYKIKNANEKRGSLDCFVTDLPRQFEKLGRIFLGESINEPQLVDGF